VRISLKKADFLDIEFLWYLRNQPDVYKYSRKNRAASWKEHIDWILPIILGTAPKDLFVIKRGLLPIGQIRFDCLPNEKAEISISILKEFRRKGVGLKSCKKAINLLKKTKKVKIILAEVQKDNISSQKFFEKLKFKLKGEKVEWLEYILKL